MFSDAHIHSFSLPLFLTHIHTSILSRDSLKNKKSQFERVCLFHSFMLYYFLLFSLDLLWVIFCLLVGVLFFFFTFLSGNTLCMYFAITIKTFLIHGIRSDIYLINIGTFFFLFHRLFVISLIWGCSFMVVFLLSVLHFTEIPHSVFEFTLLSPTVLTRPRPQLRIGAKLTLCRYQLGA